MKLTNLHLDIIYNSYISLSSINNVNHPRLWIGYNFIRIDKQGEPSLSNIHFAEVYKREHWWINLKTVQKGVYYKDWRKL